MEGENPVGEQSGVSNSPAPTEELKGREMSDAYLSVVGTLGFIIEHLNSSPSEEDDLAIGKIKEAAAILARKARKQGLPELALAAEIVGEKG